MTVFAGCAGTQKQTVVEKMTPQAAAEKLLKAGEIYRAKKIAEEILKQKPGDPAGQKLMAQILEEEISFQKKDIEAKPIEEMSGGEKRDEVKTWLERSRSLFELHQYEQAMEAAEKVFLYDGNNQQASEMMNQIRDAALKDGRNEMFLQKELAEDEIQGRIRHYREQAAAAIEAGQWGIARLSVQKILLLSPEDPEGLRLDERIRKHRGPAR